MNEPITPLSQQVADEFIITLKAMNEASFEAFNSWKNLSKSIWKSELKIFESYAILNSARIILYKHHYKYSTFPCNLYWKRKLYKTFLSARANNQCIEYIKRII